MTDHTLTTTHGHSHPQTRTIVRSVLIGLLVAVVVAIVLDNRHDVRLDYVFGDANAPAWMVILAAALCGMAIGWLVRRRGRRA